MNRCPNCHGTLTGTMRPRRWCPACRSYEFPTADPECWAALDDLNDIGALLTFAKLVADLADCPADRETLVAFARRIARRAEEVADSYEVIV